MRSAHQGATQRHQPHTFPAPHLEHQLHPLQHGWYAQRLFTVPYLPINHQAATATLVAAGTYALTTPRPAQCESMLFKKKAHALPEYTAEEVAKHTTRKSRVWVTYKVSAAHAHAWMHANPTYKHIV